MLNLPCLWVTPVRLLMMLQNALTLKTTRLYQILSGFKVLHEENTFFPATKLTLLNEHVCKILGEQICFGLVNIQR